MRSLEAGHPIPTAISLVGREMPDPIGSEFGMAADEIAFGATLEQAVARIADRCRHPDVDLFAAAIRLQEKSRRQPHRPAEDAAPAPCASGDKMRLKIRAASSEGRMSAYILTGRAGRLLHLHQHLPAALLRRRAPRAVHPDRAGRARRL